MMEELEAVQQAIADDQHELARNLLRVLIEKYPDEADVWFWAAQVAVNTAQRRHFLEKAVDLDPLHHRAANQLYNLDHPQQASPPVRVASEPASAPSPAQPSRTGSQPASFSRRMGAYVIDIIILMIAFVPLVLVVSAFTVPTNQITTASSLRFLSIATSLSIVLQGIYFGYFLTWQNGQTPGKKMMNIRVVKRDASPITLWDALLRNVIGYSLSNLTLGFGYLWMFSDANSQTWHDLIADTRVVDADTPSE